MEKYSILSESIIGETEIKEKYLDYLDTNFEAARKLKEHISRNIKVKDREKAIDEINALNLNIRSDFIDKLIDISPNTPDQVKAILSQISFNISDDNARKIISIIKKYQ
ncbi:MAG: hypothetical protein OH318_02740 [Candidatus Parvarchaeota archaeon]|nr:hypothetical protein [Candidatus Rehaiarchaeum fermentans]MCW1292097.1 hypothetical protein [Candidatus Rehaiarchaeum fermentans]MCW1293280.1 hypothetical protein [Candidatus Rehaiarchaeum fermentans]